MEAVLAVVGFLGAGKTTLLRQLITRYTDAGWQPFVILNDYENAHFDVQQLAEHMAPEWIKALSGSCICCSGITELRNWVNNVPERTQGITLIEANGTSDACELMGFLGVGLDDRFLPPVQISVVDVNHWQQRGEDNALEANQVQVSSLIVLSHIDEASTSRHESVVAALRVLNPSATIITMEELDISVLPELSPPRHMVPKIDHHKTHWSSCSADLPALPSVDCIHDLCRMLPSSILRVKGCTQIGQEKNHTYFERRPDGQVDIRPFNGVPVTGSKILIVGPGSEPKRLEEAIAACLLPAG